MNEYVKALLYLYPSFKRMTEDFGEHIKNKAYLSFECKGGTERYVEYLAGEVIKKKKMEEISFAMDELVDKLSDKEKFLLEMRYFRRKKKLQAYMETLGEEALGSKRSYFRKQGKLFEKLCLRLKRKGLTEEEFIERYGELDGISSVMRFIRSGKEEKLKKKERALVELLADGRA